MIWVYPLVAVLGTTISSAILWKLKPEIFVRAIFRFMLYKMGFSLKSAQAGQYKMCYAERGKFSETDTTLVLLHGFAASKDVWTMCTKYISRTTHIVIPDLPGHGDSDIPGSEEEVSVESSVDIMSKLFEAIGLDKHPFHLVGTSLGGTLSLLYTHHYPSHVKLLTIMCPAIITPEETDFMKEVQSGEMNRLLPRTPEEMQYMLDSCYYRKRKFNRQILLGAVQMRMAKYDYLTRVWFSLLEQKKNYAEFKKKFQLISIPTQLVWGENDLLVHVSGVKEMEETLPNLKMVTVLEKCGHSISMELPQKTAELILDFREKSSDF